MTARIRRLQFRVEHQQVALSITEVQPLGGEPPSEPPVRCPQCGSGWLPDNETALNGQDINLDLLQSALIDQRLHFTALSSGQILLCERSFHQIIGRR